MILTTIALGLGAFAAHQAYHGTDNQPARWGMALLIACFLLTAIL